MDQAGPALELEPRARRQSAMASWRRRSRLVQRFRRWLPLAIAAVLLTLLGSVVIAALLGRGADDAGDRTTIRMVNPEFLGRDDDNQAFALSAKEASRVVGSANRIQLDAPVIVLNREGPQPTRVTAKSGVYDEATEVLHLRDNVVMNGGTGQFVTNDAVIDTNRQSISGSAPIQGIGPTGRIAADSYHLYDGGARATFTGNVRARLEPRSGATPPPAP
jgi:lipopolysaccharide export system protein LptC